jgi:hypothetical protein
MAVGFSMTPSGGFASMAGAQPDAIPTLTPTAIRTSFSADQ